jgi:hypothetical protein
MDFAAAAAPAGLIDAVQHSECVVLTEALVVKALDVQPQLLLEALALRGNWFVHDARSAGIVWIRTIGKPWERAVTTCSAQTQWPRQATPRCSCAQPSDSHIQ